MKNTDLPNDVIKEILCRLSVKSLVRFCCVSKYWKKLITEDRDFIKSHLKQSLHNNLSSSSNRIISEPDFRYDLLLQSHEPSRIRLPRNVEPSEISFPQNIFVGCCNGILCYHRKATINCGRAIIYLWNPALHQLRRLPPSHAWVVRDQDPTPLFGFVFDSFKDDYKVVRIHREIEIYSLRKDTWKVITSYPLPCRVLDSYTVFYNGALHWISRMLNEHSMVLNVFDIATEELGEISVPQYVYSNETEKCELVLGIFRNLLSFMVQRRDAPRLRWIVELWITKDSLWSKQFIISGTYGRFEPQCFTRKGKIVAKKRDGCSDLYACYDPVNQKPEEEILQDEMVLIKEADDKFAHEYFESLVSVLEGGEEKEGSCWRQYFTSVDPFIGRVRLR